MVLESFIARWSASGAGERANKDSFLNELCDILGVERPHPKTGDADRDLYVFEKGVSRATKGGIAAGFIDLYKHGCFLLEAKQGAVAGPKRRNSPAWNQLMNEAHGQALGYAAHLAAPPPFLLVCDLGNCFDLYASFDGTGAYRAFPDGLRKRIFLRDLAAHADLLRAIWTDPLSLDPAKRSTAVTREIAGRVAELARALEAAGQDPERVATFLMRCLFTMFAEDIGLLPKSLFSRCLEEYWLPSPASFPVGVASLWRAMYEGACFLTDELRRFGGNLFSSQDAPRLTREQLGLLLTAAKSDWSDVDPAIFGTLLERALDSKERHRLGAHYTPRAYVERLVRPAIEEPLRDDWDVVRATVRRWVDEGKVEAAQKSVLEFHRRLCRIRVLDPACGTGNFLYVTLDFFKRLESEVLALLAELGDGQIKLEMQHSRVTPEQFLGIEVKRWAREIAELVLWIGYLQWQVRQPGGALTVPEPVLRDYGNIEWRDALLAWDREEMLCDQQARPVCRWDGATRKISPVTGEAIPDEAAQLPISRLINPREATWPAADFIVGNPPYLGSKRMRLALGEGYVQALRRAHPDVPETADYVMYWWNQAARRVADGKARRFGLITTNSIAQTASRKLVERFLASGELSLVFAIPDHPWGESADGAAVRVALTVAAAGEKPGRRWSLLEGADPLDDRSKLSFHEETGRIHADLSIGMDVTSAGPLAANTGLSFMGVTLVGKGFRLELHELAALGLTPDDLPSTVRPYLTGKDLMQGRTARFVIDFFATEEEEARRSLPAAFQRLFDRVYPERRLNPRPSYRDKWWIFGEPRPKMRQALLGLSRYIVTPETAKHGAFVFLPSGFLADHTLFALATDDAAILGVLSSRAHRVWALAAGSRLGFGNDPRWRSATCFESFPFPAGSERQAQRVRELGEELDALRKCRQALYPKLTLTEMYNVLEKLRRGEPLSQKERVAHEQGLVSTLRRIHDELDTAVFATYGWPPPLSDEEILARLIALNQERCAEEERGLVRWLRPEVQNLHERETQATLAEAGLEMAPSTPERRAQAVKPLWPKDLPARVVVVRDLLTENGGTAVEDVLRRYRGVKAVEVEKLLESLVAVGLAIETSGAVGHRRTWNLRR